ncbi:MAG: hypothetical protein FWG54_01615 [Bacteroidetes bacterium]|nr:hypothetical protein [Bacteroidota bacterium]
MKKKLFTILFVVILTTVCAQAQIYAGGTLSFDVGGNRSSSDKGPMFFYFELSPMAGYYLFPKLSVGAQLTLGAGSNDSRSGSEGSTYLTKATLWGISPFARYTLIEANRVLLLAECTLHFNGASTKSGYGGSMSKGPTYIDFGIGVLPVLSFRLTEKLNLEARTGLFRFGFGVVTTKYSSSSKSNNSYFGFGVNSSSQEVAEGMLGSQTFLRVPPFEIGLTFSIK